MAWKIRERLEPAAKTGHEFFFPDGKRILFTSDKNGYANLYMVELPEDISVLPVMNDE
ncbi:hypothetical protein [Paenibacillus sp. 1P07SE]|uniref:hypothetical protein n=1 Tax=Paenibacillus sp. 1P07SE TaxID=3132209 RepID=UPI0039A6DC4D